MPKKVASTDAVSSEPVPPLTLNDPEGLKRELGAVLAKHGALFHPVAYIDEETGAVRARLGVVPAQATSTKSTLPA